MSSLISLQRSWTAAMVGGVAWALSAIPVLVFSVEGTGEPGSFADFFIETMHFIAEACILFALPVYRARQIQRYGRLGEAGYVLAFFGNALIFIVTLLFVFLLFAGVLAGVDIGAEIGETLPTILFMAGLVGIVIGFPMLGIATIRSRIFPWWTGALMIAYPIAFFVSLGNYALWLAVGILWLGLGVVFRTQGIPESAAS